MAKEFSIAMAVYKNDAPDYLRDALKSVIDQTLKPNEIVIVGDGPISEECKKTIEDMSHEAKHEGIDLVFLPQEENNGLEPRFDWPWNIADMTTSHAWMLTTWHYPTASRSR